MRELWIYLIIMNTGVYMMMSVDKIRARAGGRRIPERTLLLAAAAGGSLGAWLAMMKKRHKTKHPMFYAGLPMLMVLHACILIWLTP